MMDTPADKLALGLRRLARAAHDPDLLGPALLSLHGALEDHLRARLAARQVVRPQQPAPDPARLGWATVLDMAQRHGDLSRAARQRVQYASALRDEVARGGRFRGARGDVESFARLARSIVGDVAPEAAIVPPAPRHRGRTQARLRALWGGRGRPLLGLWLLAQVALAAVLLSLAWPVGLALLAWPQPGRVAGAACLLLAVSGALWAARSGLRAVAAIGLRWSLVAASALYLGATLLASAAGSPSEAGWRRWSSGAARVNAWVAAGADTARASALDLPRALGAALSAQPGPIGVPLAGLKIAAPRARPVPTPITRPSPTPAPAAPTPRPAAQLRVGDEARVFGTAGAPLRARREPGLASEISARFQPDSLLRIVGGPRMSEGRVWWQVRGSEGTGWCAGEFLAPERPASP